MLLRAQKMMGYQACHVKHLALARLFLQRQFEWNKGQGLLMATQMNLAENRQRRRHRHLFHWLTPQPLLRL